MGLICTLFRYARQVSKLKKGGPTSAIDRRICKVHTESDAQQVIKFWKLANFDKTVVAGILQEIQELNAKFQSFRMRFISRDTNEAAHVCAKHASESLGELYSIFSC